MKEDNALLVDQLVQDIVTLGYNVHLQEGTQTIIANQQLHIKTEIITNPNYANDLIHLMINTSHPIYFPDGIIESLAGIGSTIEEKIASVLDNYISTTFTPIIESCSDTHAPNFDFFCDDVLWHPFLGNLHVQGEYNKEMYTDELYQLLITHLQTMLSKQVKFHWLKIYISKTKSGDIIGECLLDNEPWDEGLNILNTFAETLEVNKSFTGIKQFVMFRKCDKYDTTSVG